MTVTPTAPPTSSAAERARRFVEVVLIPNEELAERTGGAIPDELKERIRRESVEAGLSGGLHAREHGGQGWSKLDWCLVEEQLDTDDGAHGPAPPSWSAGCAEVIRRR